MHILRTSFREKQLKPLGVMQKPHYRLQMAFNTIERQISEKQRYALKRASR